MHFRQPAAVCFTSLHCCIAQAGVRIMGLCPTAVKVSKEKQYLTIILCALTFKFTTNPSLIDFCVFDTMADAQTCYYPDGTVAPGDTPCRSPSIGEGSSACCAKAHICLSNSLCLHTDGQEAIARGSCTDETWQSSECAQYCSDGNSPNRPSFRHTDISIIVNLSSATGINLVDVDQKPLFCCGNMNPFNNTCLTSSKGSFSPFFIEAGLVVFNRTSGSTSPNSTDTATIIITSTVTAAPFDVESVITTTATAKTATTSNPPCDPVTSPSPSSRRDAAIAAGVSSSLGLGLFVACALLWKQRKQKQSLRKDAQIWKGKYSELMRIKTDGVEQQLPSQLSGWTANGRHDQSHLPAHLEICRPSEIDGTQIYEVANRIGRD